MNKVVLVFRILSVMFTTVWGLFFGVLFPLYIIFFPDDTVNVPLANSALPLVWLLTALLGVILPCVLVFIHKRISAVILSCACAVSVLIMHLALSSMLNGNGAAQSRDAAITYLPMLFANLCTCLSVAFETAMHNNSNTAADGAAYTSTLFETEEFIKLTEADGLPNDNTPTDNSASENPPTDSTPTDNSENIA